MSKKVPFRGHPISTMEDLAIARVWFILALDAFNHYTVKTINHDPEEIHDAKHQTAHHRR